MRNEIQIFVFYILGTISCDFEEKGDDNADWCNFHHKNTGDNSSIQGFEWMRHSGEWVQEKNLEGPYKGICMVYISIRNVF